MGIQQIDTIAMQLISAALISGAFLGSQIADAYSVKVEDETSPQRYVHLSFDKLRGNSYEDAGKGNKPSANLLKRDNGEVEIEIINQRNFYSVELDIGTPSQNVTVLLDTGSSDLWVSSPDNPYCIASNEAKPLTHLSTSTLVSGTATATASGSSGIATVDCQEYGTFDSSKSSSFKSNGTAFSISYGDSSFASGTWGTDTFALGDLNITNLSFAVANQSNSTVGVLGIGLPGLESTYVGNYGAQGYQYANFPMVLKAEGAIDRNAYSLFLNDQDADSGSVLFGAVDHSKYSGQLYTIPMLNVYKSSGIQNPIEFDVTVQGVSIDTGSTTQNISNTQFPALLDSGTTLSYLPYALTELIAGAVGARYSYLTGYYALPCPSASNDTQLLFDFGGFQISANLSSYILSSRSSSSTCYLGMIPLSSNSAIFGDNFLIHAYVVYDLENYEISMAQAAFNNDEPRVEVISDSVPSATRAAGYSSTWSTTQPFGSGTVTVGSSGTARASSTRSGTATRRNDAGDTLAPTPLSFMLVAILSFFI